ncbi:hypothetical protein [Photobacterium atrarenae]|uniref:Uncharacterized protein n=1 Tax=Photobacterium atrarenae TaxID=865757 RepID=A0ABY5GM75_9GAMM|nr:hypothetical protein [Photobacterium atrarenae]UTV30410.1 hypothetical protein NNL38_17695 [Photobacterium atrarenae]
MDKIRIACFVSTLTLLPACGGDSSSNQSQTGTENTGTTNFKVSVDAPAQLLPSGSEQASTSFGLLSLAYADTVEGLEKENFAVAVIGPDGKVVEKVTLTDGNWERENDGTYTITLPGGERLDCVVLVSLDDGTPAVQIGEQLPTDVLLAPTTSTRFQVDLNSSVAYQAIVDEIAAADGWGDYAAAVGSNPADIQTTDELVSELIASVADNVDSLVENLGALNFDVATVLATPEIKELATKVVERIKTERDAVTTNAATVLESGLWWLWSAQEWTENNARLVELEAGKISFNNGVTTESIYEWDSNSEDPITLTEADMTSTQSLDAIDTTNMNIDSWVLTQYPDEAWQAAYDMIVFRSADQNKAVFADIGLHQDPNLDHQITLKEINLAGKKVSTFLSYPQTQAFLPYLPKDLTFGGNAKGYKIEEQAGTDIRYELWHDNDCDPLFNGNCNRAWLNGEANAPTELAEIVAETASTGPFVGDIHGVWLSQDILAELIDDAGKTLVLWYRAANDNFTKAHTDTWQEKNIYGETLYIFTVPEELAEADQDFDADEREVFFAVQNGFVRKGAIKSSVNTDSELLLNQAAIDTIYTNASVDNLPQFGRCTEGDKTTSATESDLIQALANCGFLRADNYMDTFYGHNLVRVNGNGETRAYQFKNDGTFDYFKDGLQRTPRQWQLDDGLIRIHYDDQNDPSYELLALTQADVPGGQFAFKIYTHDAYPGEPQIDEVWSYVAKRYDPQTVLTACEADDSGFDDQNSVPFEGQEKTMQEYEQAVTACRVNTAGDRQARYTARGLQNKAWQVTDEETEYMLYFDTDENNDGWFDGLFRNVDPNDAEEVGFEWQIVDDQYHLKANIDGIDLTELGTIVAANGTEFSVKYYSKQSNWPTDFNYMDEDEGEIWSETYRVIELEDVPALPQ